MKKFLTVAMGLPVVVIVLVLTWVYLPKLGSFLRGVRPVITSPPQDITAPSFNTTGLPLNLPPGFSMEIFAKDLPGARVMAFDGEGNMWVSQTGEGKISLLEIRDDKMANRKTVLENLRKPHGLAFDPQDPSTLYVAEEHQISRFDLSLNPSPGLGRVAGGRERSKIADLPSGGRHFTRTIGFGPEGRLYVSIGSSCDSCVEKDKRRAAIYSMNKDGSDFKSVATGLRNAVFFTWNEVNGTMWATEMGRDYLGDDLPPDEINIIHPKGGSHYGWPFCYGKAKWDFDFNGDNTNIGFWSDRKGSCENFQPSHIDLPAHSAPLGLAFVPEAQAWPQDYWDDLLVAYHGSWNRSVPTGYKVVRVKLDAEGNYEGIEDFITGWLASDGKTALGRPVDILVQPGGIAYISDDKAGVIYRVAYQN